ncbi:MAG: HAMP domain-containing sensor histidine kinase [Bdellovibrionota bacterium]
MRFKILGIVAAALALFSAFAVYKTSNGFETANLSAQNRVSESFVRSSVVVAKQVLQTFQTMTPEKLGILKTRKEFWPEGWQAFKDTSTDGSLYLRDTQYLTGANVGSFLNFVATKSPNLKRELEIHVWRDESQKARFVVFVQKQKQFLAVLIQNPLRSLSTVTNATTDAELTVINELQEMVFSEKAEYLGQKTTGNPVLAEIKTQGLEQNAALFKSGGKEIWGRYQKIPNTNLYVVRTSSLTAEKAAARSQGYLNLAIFGGLSLVALGLLALLFKNKFSQLDESADQDEEFSRPRHLPPPPPSSNAMTPFKNPVNFPAHPGSQEALLSDEKLSAYKRMVASLGHEIRRPLFSVMGKIQMAHGQTKDPAVNRDLERAVDELRDLRGNLDKLLSFSGEKNWEKIETQIETPLSRLLKDYESKFTLKKVEVVKSFNSNEAFPLEVEGLQRAFENILDNALESMERMQSKKLEISTRTEGNNVVVTFKDSGEGMPPEVQAKAVEPFFTTRSYAHHMGLGLWQAYSIVNAHGGELEFSSKSGTGTEVKMIFPLPPNAIRNSVNHPQLSNQSHSLHSQSQLQSPSQSQLIDISTISAEDQAALDASSPAGTLGLPDDNALNSDEPMQNSRIGSRPDTVTGFTKTGLTKTSERSITLDKNGKPLSVSKIARPKVNQTHKPASFEELLPIVNPVNQDVSIPHNLPLPPLPPSRMKDDDVHNEMMEDISVEKLHSLPPVPRDQSTISERTNVITSERTEVIPSEHTNAMRPDLERTTISTSHNSSGANSPLDIDIDALLELSDSSDAGQIQPDAKASGSIPTPPENRPIMNDDKTPVALINPPQFKAPTRFKDIDAYAVTIRRPGESNV